MKLVDTPTSGTAADHAISFKGISVDLTGTAQTDQAALNAAFGEFGVEVAIHDGVNTSLDFSQTANIGDYLTFTVPAASSSGGISVKDTTTGAGDADTNALAAVGAIDTAIKDELAHRQVNACSMIRGRGCTSSIFYYLTSISTRGHLKFTI